MKRFVAVSFVTGLLLGGALAAYKVPPVAAAGDDSVILKADQAFTASLAKSDKTAVGDMLDAKFEWTDADGKTRNKAEALADLAALAADNSRDSKVKVIAYSELGVVHGYHHDVRFGRIWAKRPAGWRVMVILDTPLPKPGAAAAPGKSGGDCDNPCRTLPFKPVTAADKAMLTEWQKTKLDEWHPDADDWATHVAEEFVIINDRAERDKPTRVAFGKKQQEAGISMPGDPITSMNLYDFGDTILMISHHFPYNGGKPYYSDRVFVHRGDHWLISWSQQTTNQAAAAVPGVGQK